MSNTRKIVKGISSQTIVTIILGIVEIISFSIMSRLLSKTDFGYYAAMVAIAAVFQSLADTGIGASIIQKKELDQSYINNAFSLSLIFGLSISGLLCGSAGFLSKWVADETMTTPLRIFSITLLCSCLSSVNISMMQRQMKFIRIGLVNLIALIITTCIAIFLAVKGYGYYAILTKAVLQSILVLVISYLAAHTRYAFRFDIAGYKRIFSFSGWLMASAVFRNLAHQMDRLMMSSLFSVQTLGFYNRPKEFISNITSKFSSIFDSVLFPVLSTFQDEKNRLCHSYGNALYILNMSGALISVALFFNSELIIRIFFGEQWLHVNTLFCVLSIYPVFLINGRLADVYLRSLALTKQQFFFRVGQVVLAVVFILIGYRFGVVSMAIALMLSYVLITGIKITYLTKQMDMPIGDVVLQSVHAYKFILFMVPVWLLCIWRLPHTFMANIIQAVVFCIAVTILFLCLPKWVGMQYYNMYYNRLNTFINQHLFHKNEKCS